MAILTKNQLSASNASSFPDNNTGAITPAILRNFNTGIIDTLVDSLVTSSYAQTDISNDFTQANSFTSISASSFVSASNFVGDGSKLTNITASIALPILDEGVLQGYATSMNFTGSAISASVVAGTALVQVNIEGAGFVTTSSFNAFTSSTNQFTQSASSSISQLNASSASQQVSINALNVYTASQSSASIVNSIDSLNSFTQSQETFNSTISAEVTALEIATASLFTSVSNLNASSASQQISINALNTNSASVNTSISALNQSSASQQVSINAINQATQSLQSKTGSYATTGSNTFNGGQTIFGALSVTDGAAQLEVGVNGDIVSMNSGINNINFFFGGDAAFNGDTITLRNTGGDAAFALYNGTGVGQKAYGTKVTSTGASGSYVINDVQNNKDYITIGGTGENVVINSPLSVSGNLTASLQQGYVWVGNASGISNAVATSSLQTNVSGFVTTSSFNSYTSSNDQRVSSLEINSASVNISVSALNTFTASQSTASLVTSIDNLNTFSASALVSISNLNSATASLFGSASLALTTASFDNGTRNLTFTKGDNQTFSVNIPDVSGSAGTFVTTASFNAYTQSNDQRVSSLEANSASVNTSITNINTTTASLNSSVSQLNASSASQQISIDNLNAYTTSVNTFITSSEMRLDLIEDFTQSAQISITNINSATASLFTSASLALVTASASGNTITFTKGDSSTFNVSVVAAPIDTGSFATTASFNAYTQSNDQRVSSLEATTASLNTSASLALVTASFDNGTRNLTFTKGNTTTFSVNIPDASGSAPTTIYDTVYTGESITKGDPLYISGSQGANPIVFKADAAIPAKMPVTYVSNQTIGAGNTTEAIILGHIEGVDLTGYTAGQSIYVAEGGGYSTSLPSGSNSITQLLGVITKGGSGGKGLVLNPGPAQLPGLDNGKLWVGNSNNQPVEITTASFVSSASFNSYTQSTDNRLNNIETTTASLNTSVSNLNTFSSSTLVSLSNLNTTTASLLVETNNLEAFSASALISLSNLNTATASLFTSASLTLTTASVNLNTITFTKGDGTTFPLTVNTGSGGGGGAAFPYVGDAQISGSLGVTGSFNGFVNSLSIAANTASMNFNNGNFFTLQLVSGSITHLTATNIRPGQTINLLVKTDSGSAAASGSLTFSPTFKFAGGFDYTPTQITASQDLVSFVTFDTTQIFAAQVKNLS